MNDAVLRDLLEMAERDASTRRLLLAEGRLFGGYYPEMQKVQAENAARLDGIVGQHGWPGISLVGIEGCRAAWLIAQHAIGTPDLQRKFLRLLEDACARSDAPARQLAFLTDRIRFNEGRPQVYGTVFDWDRNGDLSCAVEESETLDGRRAAVGLPTYAESARKERQAVAEEGGKPPSDLSDYHDRAAAWARSIGWR